MSQENPEFLTLPAAIAVFRRLSGSEGYPFREEGERRYAEILQKHCSGVTHAGYVVDEYDAGACPTVEQLRSKCIQTSERCRCGIAKWSHEKSGCGRFSPAGDDEFKPDPVADKAALKNLREMVPLIPGVDWQVCLQIQCLRIAIEEAYKNQQQYLNACRDFPEAMASIRAGQDPDPAIVERILRERGWMKGGSVRSGDQVMSRLVLNV